MKSSIKKLGVATGVFLIATAMSPAFNSSHAILQNLGSTTVEASSSVTYKTKANLNLRSGASTSKKVLVTIPKGKGVTYILKTGSWSKVKYGSKIGYVSSSYLTKVTTKAPAPKVTKTPSSVKTYTVTANLNLRTGASIKSSSLLTIPKGKMVTYVSKIGSWSKVKYGSKTGYVSTKYLKVTTVAVKPVVKPAPKPVAKPVAKPAPKPVTKPVVKPVTKPIVKPVVTPPETPKAPPVQANKEYVTTNSLNMRSGASTKHNVVTTIPSGKVVEFIEEAPYGWFKISYNGKTGYVSSYYLRLNVKEVFNSTKYGISLNEMVSKQYSLRAQTDAYRSLPAYIAKSAVKKAKETDTTGVITITSPVVSSELANSHVYGTLVRYSKVTIVGESETHYEIRYQAWRNAKSEDVKPNVDPTRFSKGSSQYFQFLDLSASANVTATELNKVLNGKGILNNQGNAFVEAGKQHGVNEVYLVSHALLETGQGNSQLATGVLVDTVNGQPVTPKVVYNMFGIGAYDATALKSGSERAYLEGWTTPEKAIIGGAKFIGNMYVNHPTYKQNTLYKMRWNPERPGSHQYATDIGWAVKQTTSISNLYKALDDYSLTFDVPVYR